VIAAVNPFDVAFARLTLGSSTLRVGLFAFLASSGALFAARADLELQPHGTRHPILVGLAAALFVALAIALIDGVLFRNFLPAPYVEFFRSTTLGQRLTYFMLRAFNENVFYRLFVFSALTFVINKAWRKKSDASARGGVWIAMVIAQTINIWLNVVALSNEPVSLEMLAY